MAGAVGTCELIAPKCKDAGSVSGTISELRTHYDYVRGSPGYEFDTKCKSWRANGSMNAEQLSELGRAETALGERLGKFKQQSRRLESELNRIDPGDNFMCQETLDLTKRCLSHQQENVENFERNLCSVASS